LIKFNAARFGTFFQENGGFCRHGSLFDGHNRNAVVAGMITG
jgi:hypothetical protein